MDHIPETVNSLKRRISGTGATAAHADGVSATLHLPRDGEEGGHCGAVITRARHGLQAELGGRVTEEGAEALSSACQALGIRHVTVRIAQAPQLMRQLRKLKLDFSLLPGLPGQQFANAQRSWVFIDLEGEGGSKLLKEAEAEQQRLAKLISTEMEGWLEPLESKKANKALKHIQLLAGSAAAQMEGITGAALKAEALEAFGAEASNSIADLVGKPNDPRLEQTFLRCHKAQGGEGSMLDHAAKLLLGMLREAEGILNQREVQAEAERARLEEQANQRQREGASTRGTHTVRRAGANLRL